MIVAQLAAGSWEKAGSEMVVVESLWKMGVEAYKRMRAQRENRTCYELCAREVSTKTAMDLISCEMI